MKLWMLAEDFAQRVRECETFEALKALLVPAASMLGFEHVELVRYASPHVDLPWLNRLDNAPPAWTVQLLSGRLYLDDPIAQASRLAGRGFAWRDAANYVVLSPAHHAFLVRAAEHGLVQGFTVPLNLAGQFSGACSFSTASHRPISFRALHCADIVGSFAIEAFMRLQAGGARRSCPHLTPRQLECVRWLMSGKTAPETAIILGLSVETVRAYLKSARAAFNVVDRTQLVVAALRSGIIAYDDSYG